VEARRKASQINTHFLYKAVILSVCESQHAEQKAVMSAISDVLKACYNRTDSRQYREKLSDSFVSDSVESDDTVVVSDEL